MVVIFHAETNIILSLKRDIPDLPRPDVPSTSVQTQAAGASKRRKRYAKMKCGRAAPICQHNVITHVSHESRTMKARCSRMSGDSKPDSLPKPKVFGEFISADHAIFGDGHVSRKQDAVALIIQDSYTCWLQAHPARQKMLVLHCVQAVHGYRKISRACLV